MAVRIVDHPVVQDALLELRDARTPPPAFRRAAGRVAAVLAVEALRDVATTAATVVTPIEEAAGRRIASDIIVVPVLRAGLGILDAVLTLVPDARVGHIGLERDELTAQASQYYLKLPTHASDAVVLLLDPMLATGGSANAALNLIRRARASASRPVRLVSIVAAPEGVEVIERNHPDVTVYAAVVDTGLNAKKYIVPGLGDFGDRLYGTL